MPSKTGVMKKPSVAKKNPAMAKASPSSPHVGKAAPVSPSTTPKVFAMPFAKIYACYVAKATKKGRSQQEVDEIIRWLTGFTQRRLEDHAGGKLGTHLAGFFADAKLNPKRKCITGKVCGVEVSEVQDATMREIRYLDKLIDELAQGKHMGEILRK